MEVETLNNINSNIANYLKNEYQVSSASNANAMLEAKENVKNQAVDMLKNLVTGDKITANILDITGTQVTIGTGGEGSIKAFLANNMPVNIGDVVTFVVNKDNENQVLLKPLIKTDNATLAIANKALEAANMPLTDKNSELVMNLVKNNMPINKESLSEFSRYMTSFPDANVDTFVELKKLGMPITSENVTQFENYINFENSISDSVSIISENMSKLAEDDNGINILKEFVDFTDNTSKDTAKSYISDEKLATLSGLVKDEELANEIKNGNLTSKELLSKLLNDENFKEIAKSPVFKEVSKMFMRDQFELSPKDVAKDNEIKNFYERILKETNKMQELLTSCGKQDSSLFKEMSNVKDNVYFMNDLNHMMTYVQLPLKFAGQDVHSDLYVFRNKGQKIDKDDISALLHLDMDNLGKMDVYVKLTNGVDVSTNFCLENEEMLDFIEAHMDQLNGRLEALGYKLHATTKVANTEHDIVHDFIDEGKAHKDFMRYSFDIRA